MQNTLITTQFISQLKKIKAKRSENSSLSYGVASKVWCYIRTTITYKNRQYLICGLAHGGE